MNLHPELATLQRRYDELVDAVEDGSLSADAAMATLGSLCATDATGAEWRLDASGSWTRNLPGEQPYPSDPSAFVTTAGWSDNGWGPGGSVASSSQTGDRRNDDPYGAPVTGWGGEPDFHQPFAPGPGSYANYDQPMGPPDLMGAMAPTGAAPAPKARRGTSPRPRPRLPRLPSLGGLGDRLGPGRARTIVIVAVCLFVLVGLFNRDNGTDAPAGNVPETLTTESTQDSTTGTTTGEITDTTTDVTTGSTAGVNDGPGSTAGETGTSTAGAAPATDTPKVTTRVEPGKGITLDKAQAVVDALVGGPKTAAVVTGATGGQLIDVGASFAGAAKLGFRVKAESFSGATKNQADVIVVAKDRSGRTVASWTIRLVTAKGRWVVGGYPTRN